MNKSQLTSKLKLNMFWLLYPGFLFDFATDLSIYIFLNLKYHYDIQLQVAAPLHHVSVLTDVEVDYTTEPIL